MHQSFWGDIATSALVLLLLFFYAVDRKMYRDSLVRHAEERTIVFINGKPYRIVTEEDADRWERRDLCERLYGKK